MPAPRGRPVPVASRRRCRSARPLGQPLPQPWRPVPAPASQPPGRPSPRTRNATATRQRQGWRAPPSLPHSACWRTPAGCCPGGEKGSSPHPRTQAQRLIERDTARPGTGPACQVILADSGAPAYRAGLEAVESRVPVGPAQPTVPDLYVPAVTAGARVLLPEQPVPACAAPGGHLVGHPSQPTAPPGCSPKLPHTTRRTQRGCYVSVPKTTYLTRMPLLRYRSFHGTWRSSGRTAGPSAAGAASASPAANHTVAAAVPTQPAGDG